MSAARAALAKAVMATTTIGPRIAVDAVAASHGHRDDAGRRLAHAIDECRSLLAALELALLEFGVADARERAQQETLLARMDELRKAGAV